MEKTNILVVIDAQNDFCTGSLGTKEAVESVANIAEKIRNCADAGYRIITTQDTHADNYMSTREGKYLPIPHCVIGTEGHRLVQEVEKALEGCDPVQLIKYTFGCSVLPDYVRKITPDFQPGGKNYTFQLIGWCTDICVMANAVILATAFPEADIIVDSKCCAGVTPESHEAALTVMKSLQIDVI